MFHPFHLRPGLFSLILLCAGSAAFSQTASQTAPESGPTYSYEELSRLIVYPQQARARNLAGQVVVNVLVGTTGQAVETRIIKGVDPLLDSAAVIALRKLKFTPAKSEGNPLATWVEVPIIFVTPPPSDKLPEIDEFVPVEDMPRYDQRELGRALRYPETARRNGLEGEVVLRILIDKTGLVADIKVDRSTNPAFEAEAIRAVRKTSFTPAIQQGRPIAVWIQIPVLFKLDDGTPEPSYSREELAAKVVYPKSAWLLDVQGDVMVEVEVGAKGEVLSTKILRCDHELLCDAARDAVASLTFKPAMQGSTPTAGRVQVPVTFRLR